MSVNRRNAFTGAMLSTDPARRISLSSLSPNAGEPWGHFFPPLDPLSQGFPHPVGGPTNPNIPAPMSKNSPCLGSLLPYLAMSFTPLETSGEGMLCGINALTASFNAAQKALRDPYGRNPVLLAEQTRNELFDLWGEGNGFEFVAQVENFPDPSSRRAIGEEQVNILREHLRRNEQVDVEALMLLVRALNARFGTSYDFGVITNGYRVRWDTKLGLWDMEFVNVADAYLHDTQPERPVLWVINNGSDAKLRAHTGQEGNFASHWMGFGPGQTDHYHLQMVQDWDLSQEIANDIEAGVWRVVRDTLAIVGSGDRGKMTVVLRAGLFLRQHLQGMNTGGGRKLMRGKTYYDKMVLKEHLYQVLEDDIMLIVADEGAPALCGISPEVPAPLIRSPTQEFHAIQLNNRDLSFTPSSRSNPGDAVPRDIWPTRVSFTGRSSKSSDLSLESSREREWSRTPDSSTGDERLHFPKYQLAVQNQPWGVRYSMQEEDPDSETKPWATLPDRILSNSFRNVMFFQSIPKGGRLLPFKIYRCVSNTTVDRDPRGLVTDFAPGELLFSSGSVGKYTGQLHITRLTGERGRADIDTLEEILRPWGLPYQLPLAEPPVGLDANSHIADIKAECVRRGLRHGRSSHRDKLLFRIFEHQAARCSHLRFFHVTSHQAIFPLHTLLLRYDSSLNHYNCVDIEGVKGRVPKEHVAHVSKTWGLPRVLIQYLTKTSYDTMTAGDLAMGDNEPSEIVKLKRSRSDDGVDGAPAIKRSKIVKREIKQVKTVTWDLSEKPSGAVY